MAETSLCKSLSIGVILAGRINLSINILDREAGLADHLGGAARGENANILLDEALSQVQQAGLVVDRDDGDLLLQHCEE